MKTSSAKNKGRRLADKVKDLLYKFAPGLLPGDIEVTPSGCNGPDLKLSPAARAVYPFVIECKNQEKISIWEALKQTEGHLDNLNLDYGYYVPLLFFSKNNTKVYVAMEAESFIENFIRNEQCGSKF